MKKSSFIWYSAHLFVPLAAPKVLSLGNKNEKIIFHFVFLSLIRTFASLKQQRHGMRKGICVMVLSMCMTTSLFAQHFIVRDGYKGFVDENQHLVIPCEYDDVYYGGFQEGLIRVKRSGKWGCVDRQNQVVIPFEYTRIGDIENGVAHVEMDGRCGFIDKENRMVIPLEYDAAYGSDGTLFEVVKNGKWGIVNRQNQVVIPFVYDTEFEFIDDVATVVKDGMTGKINTQNQVVESFQ